MNKFLRILFLALCTVEVIFFVLLAILRGGVDSRIGSGRPETLGEWTITDYNGYEEENTTLPKTLSKDCSEIVVLKNTIPEKFYGESMYFLTVNKKVKVYLDGNEIYQLGYDGELAGKTPGTLYNVVKLPEKIDKGELEIYIESVYHDDKKAVSIIEFADRDVAAIGLLEDGIFRITLTLTIFFTAILIGLISYMCTLTMRRESDAGVIVRGIPNLAAFAAFASAYYFIQTRIPASFLGRPTYFEYMSYICFMMMPISLTIYYKANVLSDYVKYINPLVFVESANIVIQTALQIAGVKDFYEMRYVTIAIDFFVLCFGAVLLVMFAKREKSTYIRVHVIAYFIMILGFVLDLIRNATGSFFNYGDNGMFERVCCVAYCVILAAAHYLYMYRTYDLKSEVGNIKLERQVMAVAAKNEELEEARRVAEEARIEAMNASDAKSSFLARISHEIRTPINAVLGMDEMILSESNNKVVKSYATDIKNAGNTLLALINDILDFSKIESGKMELSPIEYDLFGLINDLETMTLFRAEAKNLKLVVNADPNMPSVLYGDDIRIKQIIMNLLTNAVKYTNAGTIWFNINGILNNDNTVTLHVEIKDTGIGIKPEDISKLYEKFQRIDEQRNRNIEGTGLGMNIAVSLLDMMNSSLNVESEYGKGSSFYFDLVQTIIDNEPMGDYYKLAQRMDKEYKTGLYAPKANILIVDDNEINCKVFKNLLKKTGINVTDRNSGKEGLSLVKENHYDIIFLDHMMPDLDGIETFHIMKDMEDNKCKDTPVIIFTANAIKGAKEMYLEEGFDDFLSKPIIPEQLENIIRQYLPPELIEISPNGEVVEEIDNNDNNDISRLPVIEGFDWKVAMTHFNDASLIFETLRNFHQTLPVELEKIQEFYDRIEDRDALNNYRIKVHALKSSSMLVGSMTVSSLAKLLEYAARDMRVEEIRNLHPILMREAGSLCDRLDEALREKKQTINDEYIMDLLEILKGKINQLDIDGCDDVIGNLEQYEIKPEASDVYKKLVASIVNIDMEEAQKAIEEIKNIYSKEV